MKIEAVSLQDLQILAAAGVVLVAEHRNQTKLHSGEMISQHFFNADGLEVAYLFIDTYPLLGLHKLPAPRDWHPQILAAFEQRPFDAAQILKEWESKVALTGHAAEKDGLLKLITHLKEAGWWVSTVNDGEEDIHFQKFHSIEAVIADASAVDEAHVFFTDGSHRGTAWLVWGNSPIELVADHSGGPFEEAINAALRKVWPNYPEE